jgi:UDP-N-acetylenolpyruvoylglucosamine reductase
LHRTRVLSIQPQQYRQQLHTDFAERKSVSFSRLAQALLLVIEHARSEADLEKFKQKIIMAVQQKFHITLEQEPELLP